MFFLIIFGFLPLFWILWLFPCYFLDFCFLLEVGFLAYLRFCKPPKETNSIIIILERINLWIWDLHLQPLSLIKVYVLYLLLSLAFACISQLVVDLTNHYESVDQLILNLIDVVIVRYQLKFCHITTTFN